MAPKVMDWEELLFVFEESDENTGEFRCTTFAAVEDDMMYYGQLDRPKADISFQQINDALTRIPDEVIFPQCSSTFPLTRAPTQCPPNIFIKRPGVAIYDVFLKHEVVHLIPEALAEEAAAMEVLRCQPHPNIVGYHGCQVRRGYITGLVLDWHPHDLKSYLQSGRHIRDKDLFVGSLESAIRHLHSLGWAHNDLNPTNILVAADQRPILIDFGSARRIGEELSTSRGTEGWIDCEMGDYTTSETQHDISALTKIREWLNATILGD